MQENVKCLAKKSAPFGGFHTTCIEKLLKNKNPSVEIVKLAKNREKDMNFELTAGKSGDIINSVNSNGAVDIPYPRRLFCYILLLTIDDVKVFTFMIHAWRCVVQ